MGFSQTRDEVARLQAAGNVINAALRVELRIKVFLVCSNVQSSGGFLGFPLAGKV
jgi:hypothetical protein